MICIEKGALITISFHGKEKISGKIFDTTSAEEAKKAGIFIEKGIYKAIPVIVGHGDIIKGLDEALFSMNKGEEKEVELIPEKAFGQRKPELIRLVPLNEFKKRSLNPVKGMPVNVNDSIGRIQSVSGGRVRVDFNNELAGKTIQFKVKIESVIENKEEKIKILLEKYFPFIGKEFKFKIEGDSLKVELKEKYSKVLEIVKPLFEKALKETLKEIKKTEYSLIKEKAKEKEESKESGKEIPENDDI
ncbi:MAG TPA: peptidylprolyl isomerase [archaeon]|nr:peptidylprolyl isomerase [archaeon]